MVRTVKTKEKEKKKVSVQGGNETIDLLQKCFVVE
jgi:hypothetical protein